MLNSSHTVLEQTFAILVNHPDARNNDKILHKWFYKVFYGTTDLGVIEASPFMPHFKTIERCRRIIQLTHEELRPDEETTKIRRNLENEYRMLARAAKKLRASDIKIPKRRSFDCIDSKELRKLEKKWRAEYEYGKEADEGTRGTNHEFSTKGDRLSFIRLSKTRRHQGTS